MGHAAHNRGSKLIRDQIDREQAAKPKRHPAEISLHHAERINANQKARIERLERDLVRASRYLKLARTERDIERAEAREWKARAMELLRWGQSMQKKWVRCSRLLRTFTPAQVQEARFKLLEREQDSGGRVNES